MEKITEQLVALGTFYGIRIIGALLVLFVGRIVARILINLLRKFMTKSKVDQTLISFTASLSYVALLTFLIIGALEILAIPTISFVAVLGAAGLAVGLALQGSLSNFASGVLMIIFKPIKIGDYVEGGGVAGVVQEIGIFATELTSPDNKKIIVPNAKITGDNIINYTAKEIRRVDMTAGVSYSDDLDKVKSTLEDILADDKRVLKDPAPTVEVVELGDSSVNFVVRPWVKTEDYWNVFFATQKAIKQRFDAEGITIPFPQQDVYMHQVEK